jgi:hypothetical protein
MELADDNTIVQQGWIVEIDRRLQSWQCSPNRYVTVETFM